MGALGLALLSGLSWGTGDFLGGLMTRRLGVAIVMAIAQGSGLVITGLLIVALGSSMPDGQYLAYGALAGLFGAIGLAALYQGLAIGPMSVVAPTVSLSVMVPVLVGLVQGDRPSTLQFVGMACAVVGIVLAARESDPTDIEGHEESPSRRGWFGRGFRFALIALVFIGLLVTFLGKAGAGSAPWAAFMVRLVSVPLFVVAALVRRRHERVPTRKETGTLVVVGAFDNLANVLFALASQTGMLALVSVLGSLYPVSTVLLARGFLHERLSRPQAIGVVTAFVGVALIALG
jgi:drug/metabolite transporter (DMT)-like permease